jgi:hypothetical protein
LIDDPISALDASARKLTSSNMLAKTARVPVTHAVDFTHLADKSNAIPDYTHLMASPDDSKKLLFQSGCSVDVVRTPAPAAKTFLCNATVGEQ